MLACDGLLTCPSLHPSSLMAAGKGSNDPEQEVVSLENRCLDGLGTKNKQSNETKQAINVQGGLYAINLS